MEALCQAYLDNLAAACVLVKPQVTSDMSEDQMIETIRGCAGQLHQLHQENDKILDKILFSKSAETLTAEEAEQLSALANLLNTHFTEVSPEAMGEKLMALTGQLPPELFMPLSLAVEYAGEVVDQSARNQVFTTGQTQLLLQPEFQDPGRANELMRLLTDQKAELPVLDENTPMQILIGPENVNEALKDASVVVASYDIGDNMRGLIGVVGPTRMDYAAVAARLACFAESLTKMFGKNNQLPPKEDEIQ